MRRYARRPARGTRRSRLVRRRHVVDGRRGRKACIWSRVGAAGAGVEGSRRRRRGRCGRQRGGQDRCRRQRTNFWRVCLLHFPAGRPAVAVGLRAAAPGMAGLPALRPRRARRASSPGSSCATVQSRRVGGSEGSGKGDLAATAFFRHAPTVFFVGARRARREPRDGRTVRPGHDRGGGGGAWSAGRLLLLC